MEQAGTQSKPVEKFVVPGREPGEGYYWYFVDSSDASPVVVEVSGGEVKFCGAEAFWRLPSTGGEFMISGVFVGPITPPSMHVGI